MDLNENELDIKAFPVRTIETFKVDEFCFSETNIEDPNSVFIPRCPDVMLFSCLILRVP